MGCLNRCIYTQGSYFALFITDAAVVAQPPFGGRANRFEGARRVNE
jgi:hypothetical protein